MATPVAEGANPVVRLCGVAVVRDGRPLLDDIDWEVWPHERWAVLGPNGSGKTTLLHVAGMRLLPTRGTVEVLGARYGRADARALRSRVAFVSQAILRSLRPTLTAHDVVLTGRHAALEPWWHHYGPDDHARADGLLADAGLSRAATQEFGVLSEGERQQVLLARALMGAPELVLLDEPAAGLDLGSPGRARGPPRRPGVGAGRAAARARDPSRGGDPPRDDACRPAAGRPAHEGRTDGGGVDVGGGVGLFRRARAPGTWGGAVDGAGVDAPRPDRLSGARKTRTVLDHPPLVVHVSVGSHDIGR